MARKPIHKSLQHPKGIVGLPRHVFVSPAYADLSLTARCVLDELQNLYMPTRNGRIGLSITNACKHMKTSYKPVSSAFHELEAHGFIECMLQYNYSAGITREWRLTFQQYNGREPTDEWKAWEPKN